MKHPGQLLKDNKLYAGKELGQNFLSNRGTAEMIVNHTGIDEQTRVVEIGPGLGALTVHIAARSKDVTVVEKDRRLVPILDKILEDENLTHVNIVNKDVMKVDFRQFAGNKKLVVIGNLPYNISSQIIFKLVKERTVIKTAFLMFQKELANRMVAKHGGRKFSRLAAVVQYAAEVSVVTDIGPTHFFPKPEVDSTVLRFDFFTESSLNEQQETVLFNVIKAAFSKRRKSLKNSMQGGEFNYDKTMIIHALEKAEIDPLRRAETLSVAEYIALAKAVHEYNQGCIDE